MAPASPTDSVRISPATSSDPLRRQAIASYLSICLALIMVVLLGVWGAIRDWTNVRSSLIDSELISLRSHAERTVFRIESQLAETYPTPEQARQVDISAIRTRGDRGEWFWLWIHWDRLMPRDRGRMYCAIVGPDGTIHRHSDRDMRGKEQGTGLGLALVRKFVEEGGGDVHCESDGRSGSRFYVRLPEAPSTLKPEAV